MWPSRKGRARQIRLITSPDRDTKILIYSSTICFYTSVATCGAVGQTLAVHTRKAEEGTERILKAEVPKITMLIVSRLLDHFPNLFIRITG